MPVHPFAPVYTPASRALILGSFPSVKSRQQNFYYGHERNRFWPVLCSILNADAPQSTQQKCDLLNSHHIALWDVVGQCTIHASSDSSIRNCVPNDVSWLLSKTQITSIFTNGQTAHRLYLRYLYPVTRIPDICLPSTSPANAKWSFDALLAPWRQVALAAESEAGL